MQGVIANVKTARSGNTIITIEGIDYFSKEKHSLFNIGSNISFQFNPSAFKGKTYNWIVDNSVLPVITPATETAAPKAPHYSEPQRFNERMKTRSMIASYVCEHLIGTGKITADVVAFDMWADKIFMWVSEDEMGCDPE